MLRTCYNMSGGILLGVQCWNVGLPPRPGFLDWISVPNDGSAQTAHCSCYGKRPGAMEVYDVEVLGYWDWDIPLNDDRRQTFQWRNAENLPCVDGVIWDPRQWLHTALQHS